MSCFLQAAFRLPGRSAGESTLGRPAAREMQPHWVNSSQAFGGSAIADAMSRFFNNCFRQLLPMQSVRLHARITKDRSGE
jgi:hypothetical protein